MISVQEKDLE